MCLCDPGNFVVGGQKVPGKATKGKVVSGKGEISSPAKLTCPLGRGKVWRLGGRLGKTPVVDEIRPEMPGLTCLCSVAWRPGTVPSRVADSGGGSQFEKRDHRTCSNYRCNTTQPPWEHLH